LKEKPPQGGFSFGRQLAAFFISKYLPDFRFCCAA
jgi:hypothetical protein